MADIMPTMKGNGRLADHEDSPPRQPRFSFGYLPCAGTSEKSTDSLGAPTHTQPGGFIDGTGFFSGIGRSSATIADLFCQLGPNIWAVKKCNSRRLLYTTFGVETPSQGTGNVGGVTFQQSVQNAQRRGPQWVAAALQYRAAKCRSCCSDVFPRRPITSKLAAMVVRRQLATGSVKGLCTTLDPLADRQRRPVRHPQGCIQFSAFTRAASLVLFSRPDGPLGQLYRAIRCAAGCQNPYPSFQSSG